MPYITGVGAVDVTVMTPGLLTKGTATAWPPLLFPLKMFQHLLLWKSTRIIIIVVIIEYQQGQNLKWELYCSAKNDDDVDDDDDDDDGDDKNDDNRAVR